MHSQLRPFVEQGFIQAKQHPTLPLTIYNYTEKAQYEKHWTPETLMCRGLILDNAGEIIARPFPKFFNLSEMPEEWKPPAEPFTVQRKEDGSLGILYPAGDRWAIATRGSFTSEQAVHATQVFTERYAHLPWRHDVTYLFEIIYPENRIVLDYGDQDELILLAVLDKEPGKDLPLPDWFPRRADPRGDLAVLDTLVAWAKEPVENEEGFVVRFESGLRLKIKYDEYVRLHRYLTGTTARSVWELLSTGANIDELVQRVPEEFAEWVRQTAAALQEQYRQIELDAILDETNYSGDQSDRRAFAEYAKTKANPAILFAMRDEKPYSQIIWKQIKPAAERPFRKGEDE